MSRLRHYECSSEVGARALLADLVTRVDSGQLANLIIGLPNRHKVLLALVFFEKLTIRQVADALHISPLQVVEDLTSAVKVMYSQLPQSHNTDHQPALPTQDIAS